MSASFIKSYDDTMKTLLYAKWHNKLEFGGASETSDKINKSVIQIHKDVALRTISEKRGYDSLEFINFYRVGVSPSWERQRTPLARRGLIVPTADGLPRRVKAQPIDIRYNAWFWTKNLDKAYQIIEDYIMWQHETPTLEITYNDLYVLQPWLHFGEVIDESTIPVEYNKGRYFVYRMPIKLDAWVLRSNDDIGIINKIRMTLYDKDYVTDYSSIVVEDSSQDVELEQKLKMEEILMYGISDVDLINNTITIPDDRSGDFEIGETIFIMGSTNNDGSYVVFSVLIVDGNTEIKLIEDLVDGTVDGDIRKVEV